MAIQPTVLSPLTLPALLNYVLTTWPGTSAAPTTLIICSSRDDFLRDLAPSLQDEGSADAECLRRLIEPTLRNLLAARHVKLAFCASVQALLAYLSAFSRTCPHSKGSQQDERETIVVVNPLTLHAPSPSFSAQGLSRTFAAAVEASARVRARLLLVETIQVQPSSPFRSDDREDIAMETVDEYAAPDNHLDPWEQEVPILNVSARRYTSSGAERPWAGRTIKASRVAAKWFRFCSVGRGEV